MFPVKVKVEKSELEMAKARNQLDAVLQCLLEKSHMDSPGNPEPTVLFCYQGASGGGSWENPLRHPQQGLFHCSNWQTAIRPLPPPAEEEEEGDG